MKAHRSEREEEGEDVQRVTPEILVRVSAAFREHTARDIVGWSPADFGRLEDEAQERLCRLMSEVWRCGILPEQELWVFVVFILTASGGDRQAQCTRPS